MGQESVGVTERIVLCDSILYNALLADSCTEPIAEDVTIEGYLLYIVEQWACSRENSTPLITVYTGNPNNVIKASVLAFRGQENDSELWSRLKVELEQNYASPRQTPHGILYVVSLPDFPSALNLILVADGAIDDHRDDFIVNENFRRMGCSGRSALTLTPPRWVLLFQINLLIL
jgi:hypothetical protein